MQILYQSEDPKKITTGQQSIYCSVCGGSTQSGFYCQGVRVNFRLGKSREHFVLGLVWWEESRNSGMRFGVRLVYPKSEGEEVDSETENGEGSGGEEFPVGRVAIGDGL